MIFIDIEIFINKIEFDVYSIESQQKICKIKDKIIIPKAFDIGSKLAYIRNIMSTLITQYKVKNAHINTENNIGIDIIEFIKIEGIIEELFSNCGVEIWR